MRKNSPTSISNLKNFPWVIPGTPVKGEERKAGRKGKEGIRDADGEEESGMGYRV
jgi:hypothetical protein